MAYLFTMISTMALGLITHEDLKYRYFRVSWLLLFVVGAMGIFHSSTHLTKAHIAANLAFIALNVVALQLYYHVRIERNRWFFDRGMGWGDVLLLIPAVFLFQPLLFIVFLLISATTGLAFAYFAKKRKVSRGIPLAGIMSIYLMIWVLFNLLY